MNPDTRQTLIGVAGLTAVEIVALWQGYNGQVLLAYFGAVVAIIAPKALEQLPVFGGGGK